MKVAVTGASGQLGRLTVKALLRTMPASSIVCIVRSLAKGEDMKTWGVDLRHGDYDAPDSLAAAFHGVQKVLLISSNAVGRRVAQHQAVIDAAKKAGAGLLCYTSILRASATSLPADEHLATEQSVKASGLPFVLLRAGWYTENYLRRLQEALAKGVLLGCAGDGKISAAPRVDFAEACAAVLTGDGHAGATYELAGDQAFTLSEFATAASMRFKTPIAYQDMSERAYTDALAAAGAPAAIAAIIASLDEATRSGALYNQTRDMSALIRRPTTSLEKVLQDMPDA